MITEASNAVPKVHPASREVLPEDPMDLRGFEVPGDPDLMMRLLVEDYPRMGWNAEAILGLANDANFQVFHGLLRMFGEDEFRRRIAVVIGRCGVMCVKTRQRESPPTELVQIELSAAK